MPPTFDNRRAVLLTPRGRGAVATVLVEGERVEEAVSRFFRPAVAKTLAEVPLGRIVFGRWEAGDGAGEELVVCRRSPTCIEVHCHGGPAAAQSILDSLGDEGFTSFDWQEWVYSAEPDPVAAQARIALASARTERTARILLDQYRGALRQAIDRLAAACEQGQQDAAAAQLEQLLRYESLGKHLATPWRVVLAGPPNVGKSSLINALLGFERAIVFDQPGTTRDVVTSLSAFDGWPVELADTAGLRESADDIEAQGVARARERLAAADLVLFVSDATQAGFEADQTLAASIPRKLVVYNKCDLLDPGVQDRRAGHHTSALTGAGVAELIDAVVAELVPNVPPPGAAVPFTEEHFAMLRAVHDLIAHGELAAAATDLRARSNKRPAC